MSPVYCPSLTVRSDHPASDLAFYLSISMDWRKCKLRLIKTADALRLKRGADIRGVWTQFLRFYPIVSDPRKLKRGIRTHFCRNVISMEIRHLGLSLMEGELLYFRHSPVRVWHFATEIPGKFAYMIRASRNTRCWKRRHGEIAHAVCALDQDLRDLTNSGLVYEKIRKYNNSAPWATTKWRRVRIPLFSF